MAEKKEYVSPYIEIQPGEEDGNARYRLPYGIAKGMGLDTTGMTPRQVWEMLKGKGVNPDNAYEELEKKAKTEIKKEEPQEVDGFYPAKQREKVYKFRNEHQKKTHEFALITDTEGNEILYKEGETGQVAFTRQERNLFKGKGLVHNHPQGNTFLSDADVKFLMSSGLKTIEAIGYDGWIHTIEVLPVENPEMFYGTEKRLFDFANEYEQVVKNACKKASEEFRKLPKTKVKSGRHLLDIPVGWTLYRKGASPRDGMNWNEYSRIVQKEVMEFCKTCEEKYKIKSTFRKG